MSKAVCELASAKFQLTYTKQPTNEGTLYKGILHTTKPFEFSYLVNPNNQLKYFHPLDTERYKIDAITEAIENNEIK